MKKRDKIIIKVFLIISILMLSSAAFASKIEDKFENIVKKKHFIIYYNEAPDGYMSELIKKAEGYYDSIGEYLGFSRFDFWLWDNRCKIFLYRDQEEYLETTGIGRKWSRAHVSVKKKEISTYIWHEKFFDTILPHEMGHIIFRELVGFKRRLPLWLDEGVACLQEIDSEDRLNAAKILVGAKLYMSIEKLSEIRNYKAVIPLIFYNQSASIVHFLFDKFGRKKFVSFCRYIDDGIKWRKALEIAYGFDNLDSLEKEWLIYLFKGN